MFVVAVFHLLGMVVVVVVAVIADVLPVADVVAAGESHTGYWLLYLVHVLRSRPSQQPSASASASPCQTHYSHGLPCHGNTESASRGKTRHALDRAQRW